MSDWERLKARIIWWRFWVGLLGAGATCLGVLIGGLWVAYAVGAQPGPDEVVVLALLGAIAAASSPIKWIFKKGDQ